MKALTTKFNMLAMLALLAMTFTISSCDDPVVGPAIVTGCMDAEAENFNELAEEDDGNCVYARDKFLGDYIGDLACPGLLNAISSDTLIFNISESFNGLNSDVGVTLNNLATTINGTVTNNTIAIDTEILQLPVTNNGLNIIVDLFIVGSLILDDSETELSGTLDITAVAATGLTEQGICDIAGIKQ